MAEIVNLNRVRKAKARDAKAVRTDANRAKFGRTKAERDADRLAEARRVQALDGIKRE